MLGTRVWRGETKRYEHRAHAAAVGAFGALRSGWVAGLVGGEAHLAAYCGIKQFCRGLSPRGVALGFCGARFCDVWQLVVFRSGKLQPLQAVLVSASMHVSASSDFIGGTGV